MPTSIVSMLGTCVLLAASLAATGCASEVGDADEGDVEAVGTSQDALKLTAAHKAVLRKVRPVARQHPAVASACARTQPCPLFQLDGPGKGIRHVKDGAGPHGWSYMGGTPVSPTAQNRPLTGEMFFLLRKTCGAHGCSREIVEYGDARAARTWPGRYPHIPRRLFRI